MDGEWIFTGYCRCLDSSRMVTLEMEEGECFVDCQYGSCPHEGICDIARSIEEKRIELGIAP